MNKAFLISAVYLCLLGIYSETDGLETILSRCCNLGIRWAWENKTCTDHNAPVTGISAEHQAPCLSTVDACCRRTYRERQCQAGHESAKSGRECTMGFGQGGHYHKDCCEGCKLGLIAGAMGLHCEFHSLKLALGPPWDTSLTRCCIQAGGKVSLPVNSLAHRNNVPETPDVSSLNKPFRPHSNTRDAEPQDFCTLFPGQLCSHFCVTEGNSYRCTCREGFKLLPDGKSCQHDPAHGPISSNPAENSHGNPQQHHQSNNGSTWNGSKSSSGHCPPGFVYNSQTQVCDDIDECLTAEGTRACYPYNTCRNTIGSFLCERVPRDNERNLQCPPGYRYNQETSNCVDIDECAEGFDICVREIQYCINTPGGFDCRGKKEFNRYNCPAGYKFNNNTLNCEDVNECAEKLDSCDDKAEVCRNTAGAYECDIQCRNGFRFDVRLRSCQDIDECTEGTHDCVVDKESCVNVPGSYQCHQLSNNPDNCPPGYETNQNYTFLCQDRDECSSGLHTCAPTETCINEIGGYRCEGSSTAANDNNTEDDDDDDGDDRYSSGFTDNAIPDNFFSTRSGDRDLDYEYSSRGTARPATAVERSNRYGQQSNVVQKSTNCPNGYRDVPSTRAGEGRACEDIDECEENNPCDSTQLCQNSVGSYYCHCKTGYYRDPVTRACVDVNECQTNQHTCMSSQRCDNSPGSFTCIRITGCGTGYTLNSQTGQCEDDDECVFGNHNCHRLGPEWQCKNTLGSFRCEKQARQCPTGMSLTQSGDCRPTCGSGFQFNSRGECIDVDECRLASTGRTLCSSHQQCVNIQGSYQCLSKIICPGGFEPDPTGTKCTDIDECQRGLDTCKGNQQCLNRGGGYICQCPQGYSVTPAGDCEDIDECTRYNGQVCASNAECHNTAGSFRCICKEGFEEGNDNRTCSDINECTTISGLCEQNCINTWGSYKCSCGSGFSLSADGRTCQDEDECAQVKEGYLCIGHCVNTHGSYKCECPDGYRLATDGRTCQDIDECQRVSACRSDETCLNTRGGFRCNRVNCPYGYVRDGDQNDRCKKASQCTERDQQQCLRQPLTISRNFISFTSNIRIPSMGYVDMFTMRGPNWAGAVMHFDLEVKSARAPNGVPIAGRDHFLLRRPTDFQAVVALARPISGPQDVELELKMEVYHRGTYAGSAVAQILIVVTTYEY